MSESQRGVDRTTAISTNYLRLITNTFEHSLHQEITKEMEMDYNDVQFVKYEKIL